MGTWQSMDLQSHRSVPFRTQATMRLSLTIAALLPTCLLAAGADWEMVRRLPSNRPPSRHTDIDSQTDTQTHTQTDRHTDTKKQFHIRDAFIYTNTCSQSQRPPHTHTEDDNRDNPPPQSRKTSRCTWAWRTTRRRRTCYAPNSPPCPTLPRRATAGHDHAHTHTLHCTSHTDAHMSKNTHTHKHTHARTHHTQTTHTQTHTHTLTNPGT